WRELGLGLPADLLFLCAEPIKSACMEYETQEVDTTWQCSRHERLGAAWWKPLARRLRCNANLIRYNRVG
ncbi:MAG: hypothetical protein KAU28_05975, partial [Phycisphaerae bacterium]|nr:hypothetical protein [Phycisphaerae bacterium]